MQPETGKSAESCCSGGAVVSRGASDAHAGLALSAAAWPPGLQHACPASLSLSGVNLLISIFDFRPVSFLSESIITFVHVAK